MRVGLLIAVLCCPAWAGTVIFVHADGAGVAGWQAARFLWVGPDGDLSWDRLPHVGVYRGHLADGLTASSNGGATAHAYGFKASARAFGVMPGAAGEPPESLMHEALKRGLGTALINSGSIIEPGTAAFVARVSARADSAEIARQVVGSGVDIILSGGEEWLLPEGAKGRHGAGKRTDGLDLVAQAREAGYQVVYDRSELDAVAPGTKKVLGIFAQAHTFNDKAPDELVAAGLPLYNPAAPTVAEMTAKAAGLLDERPFFMVVEEEGSDNFGNANNAPGLLEALRRADGACAVALEKVARDPQALVVTAADSVAGGMDTIGLASPEALAAALAARKDANGAPYGFDLAGKPFLSAPDRAGRQHPFVVTWGARPDTSGGIVVRAAGAGAENVRGTMDNTDIYRVMRKTLFSEN